MMKLPAITNAVSLSSPDTCLGLGLSDQDIDYKIDISGTRLSFRIPPQTLEDSDIVNMFDAGPRDFRPAIDTRTRQLFRFDTEGNYGTCVFLTSGWLLYTKTWFKTHKLAHVRFIASINTPAQAERENIRSLLDEHELNQWLRLFYRDRTAPQRQVSLIEHEDGTLELNFFDENEVEPYPLDKVPVKKLPEDVAGLPCYYIYLNPDIIEFNIAIARHDVLQFRFQLDTLVEPPETQAMLKKQVLEFAQRFLRTVKLEFSGEHTRNLELTTRSS